MKSLGRDEIRAIVTLLLEQVKRMAHAQDIALTFDESNVDHLADVGFCPEFGARELRRQIRQSIENELAKEMLKGDIREGAQLTCRYDGEARCVVFDVKPAGLAAKQGEGTPATP
jgi:ATP-dependent Clp protease ATP-binding subunit ClpC